MIDELHVSNLALIEDATLEFASGLTVLTGETGAGKTALLTALRLVSGARADAAQVRSGAEEACAEARIIADEEHIVRRRLSVQGRSRCTIDGHMATVGELAEASRSIEIHGQHDQVRLLQPARQLAYLDAWIGAEELIDAYRSAREQYQAAADELAQLEQAANTATQELEFMRFTCEQIEKVDPQEGELEELEEELPRLQHAEQLGQAVNDAYHALHADDAALDLLAQAQTTLSRESGIDADLDELAERLAELTRELEDLTRDIGSYAQSVQYDPYRLEEVLSRLDALSGLMRRFGPGMEQVLEAWDAAKKTLESVESTPFEIERMHARVDEARSNFEAAAHELSQARHDQAERFCAQLAAATHELAMEEASFEFSFEELPFERWTQAGSEQIELFYRPAKASKPQRLARIASGGELSRILLAIECMHYGSHMPGSSRHTIVFDEIDAGIGGATGAAIARRLLMLSRTVQVVVVTHLPQVAAVGDEQYLVSKQSVKDELPCTTVMRVTGEERVAEIARMLAGHNDETARDHARQLLSGADAL